MSLPDIKNLSISKASEALRAREFSAVGLAQAVFGEIEKKEKDIHAYLEVFDDCLEQAKEADELIKSGKGGTLTGIPLSFKDNILIDGRRVGAASKILEGYKATYDATVTKKLRDEGVVFVGRTNMDEFAHGSSTENSAYGPTKNPYDLSRVPGGSSGGSAAAVAYGGALAALGSDTGGSIRQPASLCGIVGLKPTYGAVSRFGLIAMGSSLDQIGPLTKTVADAEIIFNAIKGKDDKDSTTIDLPNSKENFKKVVGVPRHFLDKGLDESVRKNFEESLDRLKDIGYSIKDIELPNIDYSLAVYYVLMFAEVSTNLSRFDGVRYGLHRDGAKLIDDYLLSRGEGFGKEARRRILLGTYVLSHGYYDAYYTRANTVRKLLVSDFNRAFSEVDVIATPTTPGPAFKIGENTSDPLKMYLEDIFTTPANISGIPAISIPSGFTSVEGKDLPLGLQLSASFGGEETLFKVGKEFLGEV